MVEVPVTAEAYQKDRRLYTDAAMIVDLDLDFESEDPFEALNEDDEEKLAEGVASILRVLEKYDREPPYTNVDQKPKVLDEAVFFYNLHSGGVGKAGPEDLGAAPGFNTGYLVSD